MNHAVVRMGARACLILVLGWAAGAQAVQVGDDIRAIVDDPSRSSADREIDKRRHPAELLAFSGVRPGMRVLDLATGRGYTAELLARAVGPDGRVVAQNDPVPFEKFMKSTWDERFSRPAMRNVTPVVRPMADPAPADSGKFDLVTFILFYHDTVWLKTDRAAMNKRLFDLLVPGGTLIVVDHAGAAGSGATQTDTAHRIEEKVVRDELAAAGFAFVEDADFLRNPDDPRDLPFFKAEIPTDRFVLKFRRP